jgi:hypothetical protein
MSSCRKSCSTARASVAKFVIKIYGSLLFCILGTMSESVMRSLEAIVSVAHGV